MNITNLKKVFPYLLKANVSPLLWGPAGIGKTQVVKQMAVESGYNFIYLTFGAVEDVGDIIGLQDRVYDANGIATATHHLAPSWFPTTPNNIIFVDEVNRSPKSVLQAMLPFILDKRLHTHLLPENSHIVMAANPPTDEFNVGDISDNALSSRACHIVLEPTVNEFLDYLMHTDGDYSVMSFIQENPEMLEKLDKPYSLDFVKPNRRSVGEFVNNFMKTNPPQELVFEVVKGIAGIEFAGKFTQHLKAMKTKRLNGETVLNAYSKADRAYVKSTQELDVLNITTEEILRICKKQNEITAKQADNVALFLTDIPIELGYTFIRQLFMLGLDSVNKTIGENAELNDLFKNKLDSLANRK